MKRCYSLILLLLAVSTSFGQKALINPVLNSDFPDPTVIRANGKYYAYATNTSVNGKVLHIQVASSTDFQNWEIVGDALPAKPAWADADFWAPHVLYDRELKKYVLFYSGESTDEKIGKCMGVAFADKPEGPFIDKGSPLLCGDSFINIDPMAFVDPKSGKKLLYWGSAHKPIKVQEMETDWTSFKKGTAPKDVVWPYKENQYDKLIEGAWVEYHQGKYYMYYSGDNCCGVNANYAVMVARADNPFGPFKRLGEEIASGSSVILEKDQNWLAPGHNSIFKDDKGNSYIAYHAIKINKDNPEKKDGKRVFCIDRIEYKKGWPKIVRHGNE